MKKSDDLFQLIKSMSKSEKRYFKLHAGLHSIGGKNIYLKLFDSIDQMNEYDEDAIKKKFKGENFAKNLFATKNYLFNLILKILVVYNQESSIDMKLKNMLTELEILFEKGLYKPYKALMAKAEKLAKDNEKYYTLALLMDKKSIFVLTEFYSGKALPDMDNLRTDMIGYLDKIRYIYEYKILYNKLFFLLKQSDYAVSRGEMHELEKYISDPLFKDESKATSVASKFFYYSIKSFYYFRTAEFEKCYDDRKKLISIIEQESNYLSLYPRNYMSTLANLAVVCNRLGKYDETIVTIEKVKNLLGLKYKNNKAYRDVWSKIIIPLSDTELEYYIYTCRFDELDGVIERIVADVDRYTEKINEPKKILIYNLVSYAHFVNNRFKDALEFINRTLNYPNSGSEHSAYNIARIFSLIIHYEIGNFELLEYTLKNTKKFLARKQHYFAFEDLIIGFIQDSLGINNDVEKTRRIEKLKYDINKMVPDIQAKMPLEFFDIGSWIESKLKKRPFIEILKEKAGK